MKSDRSILTIVQRWNSQFITILRQQKNLSNRDCAAVTSYTSMDFLRSGFRQQMGNLDISPGPDLESHGDRTWRMSNHL